MDDPQQSLIDRAVRRLSPAPGDVPVAETARVKAVIDWRFAAALAGTIALGPLLTIVGAQALAGAAQRDAVALRAQVAPRLTAAGADAKARETLRAAVRDAPVAVWLDRAAAALPADARVARFERGEAGRLEIDVLAPDPDQVRGAMRRDPNFARFRETAQRRAGALILVTYRRAA